MANMTRDQWAIGAVALLSLHAVDETVPQDVRDQCERALTDAPAELLLGGAAALIAMGLS